MGNVSFSTKSKTTFFPNAFANLKKVNNDKQNYTVILIEKLKMYISLIQAYLLNLSKCNLQLFELFVIEKKRN